jgi:uncharacterized protein with NAD-binding domain and iron-sulfur cluster
VIGGGCAGIAAAFELSRPEHHGRYQVTVYQQGWRLGGKGASGRGASGRIEEHGLHVWLGYYENAFRLLRECYAELGRDWRAAFTPESAIGVMEQDKAGQWRPWLASFPTNGDEPGEPHDRLRWPPTAMDYFTGAAKLVLSLLRSARSLEHGSAASSGSEVGSPDEIRSLIRWLAGGTQLAVLAATLEGSRLTGWLLRGGSQTAGFAPTGALAALQSAVQRRLGAVTEHDPELRRVWSVIDVVLANMRGMLADRLFLEPHGFDAIDHWDYREWLRHHGASAVAVNSPVVRGLYDLAFAHEGGDPRKSRFAAGVALRCALRTFFTYRGALFWKLNGGMGDVVFAPFYEALCRRGVRFEFFHRLEHVTMERDAFGPHVSTLQFDVQATTMSGAPYKPLATFKGMPCWPSSPDFRQLADGERLQTEGVDFESYWDSRAVEHVTLRVNADFDQVVLSVGVGAIPHLCPELIEQDPAWAAMVKHVKTVATQAFQLWLEPRLDSLGWSHGPVSMSGFLEPFDTWSDMTHLCSLEDWANPPGTIAYFCSTLEDQTAPPPRHERDYPEHRRAEVRSNAIRFLNGGVGALWPAVAHSGSAFPWDILRDPREERTQGEREARFDTQFWTANVNPSDRYVLCLPGSLRYRISPLDPAYDNLTLAGDWTASGLNAGCVEGAVMSGRLAAHAIAQSPPLHEIVGYDHP